MRSATVIANRLLNSKDYARRQVTIWRENTVNPGYNFTADRKQSCIL